jgi:hypothetical protein
MDRISLTGFVDLVLEAGAGGEGDPLKERKGDSTPAYYNALRDAIVDMHRYGLPETSLDEAISRESSEKKRRIFARALDGYRRFLQTGTLKWFDPPRTSYPMGVHEVDVNPELGLAINETPHIIKMYFRGEPLTPRRRSVMLSLLAGRLGRICPGHVFGVLDVRQGKLHALSTPEERFDEANRRGAEEIAF